MRIGAAAVLRLGLNLLTTTLAPTAALAVRRLAVSLACAASVVAIRRRAASVSPDDPPAVYALYMELWKYFYGAYLCLPFAR